MSDLYPTKTRLALLRDVADGVVWGRRSAGRDANWNAWRGVTGRVTASIREMERVGWVKLGRPESPSFYASRPYELTDAGRAVLDAHGGAR